MSNELDAGNSEDARVSVIGGILLAFTKTILVNSALFASRDIFGYVFSSDKEVVDYVSVMAPLVCLSVVMDSFLGTLSG